MLSTYLSDHPLTVLQEEADWLEGWAGFSRFYTSARAYEGGSMFALYKKKQQIFNESRQKYYQEVFKKYLIDLKKWENGPKVEPKPIEPTAPIDSPDFRSLGRKQQTIFYSRLYNRGRYGMIQNRPKTKTSYLDDFVQQNWENIWDQYNDKQLGRRKQEKDYFDAN